MVWSIRHTLAGLFAALAVITGIQGAITLVELVRIERGVVDVQGALLPSVNAAHAIEEGVEQVRNKQFRTVLSGIDVSVVKNNLKELHDVKDALSASLQRFQALVSSERERTLFEGFNTVWESYEKLTEPLEGLMLVGRRDDAQQLLMSPWLRVLYRTVEDKLGREVAMSTRSAMAAAAAGAASATQAKISAAVAVTAAILLAIGAILVSYVRVLRPLAMVTAAMGRLAAGETSVPLRLAGRRDEIGEMVAAIEVFRDSLIRTRVAEEAGHRAEVFIEQIAATTPDGIVGLDENGLVTFWNASVERLSGFGAGEMLGQPVDRLMPPGGRLEGEARRRRWLSSAGCTIESEILHRDGHIIPVEISYGHWQQDGRDMFCTIVRDISARRAKDEMLHALAHLDPLTRLPNRTVLTARLSEPLARQQPVAVLLADLDRFKQVNDVLGHRVGDAVLKIAAQRLLACVGSADVVSRLGGDEFVLLLQGTGDPIRAATTAEAVIKSLSDPFCVDDQTIHLSASVGIALAPLHGEDPDDLLSRADMALYAAKNDGRHGHRLFTQDLRLAVTEETSCRQDLARAVEREEFELFYQPQQRLADGALVGAEALIRWRHPTRGLLTPDRFLAVLENSRHAAEVGNWVIRAACRQAAQWRECGLPGFRIGVNLSSAQFRSGDLAETVRAALAEAGLPGPALEVEITENIILRHDEALIGPLKTIKEAGVGIAFDDYGTGYASLSLLKRFPLTRLKIDKSFVRDMGSATSDAAIIRAVLLLGRSLGLKVIAEGIETPEQLAWLRHKGCAEGQGYLLGKPMPAAAFAERFGLFHGAIAAERTAA